MIWHYGNQNHPNIEIIKLMNIRKTENLLNANPLSPQCKVKNISHIRILSISNIFSSRE
jgi:hypothetical protein